MGPIQPPQRKGRVRQYSRGHLIELQTQFNELEAKGVFKRREDLGITVEYVNFSFLVSSAKSRPLLMSIDIQTAALTYAEYRQCS